MNTHVYVLTRHTEGCTKVLGVFASKEKAKSIAMDSAKKMAKGYPVENVHFYEWETHRWEESLAGHYRLAITVDFDDGDEMNVDFDIFTCSVEG